MSSTNTDICEDKLKKTRMKSITVIKHLFVWAIISIILNSTFIFFFLAAYIVVFTAFGFILFPYNGRGIVLFAAIMESIGVFATVLCLTLTMVGSCLAVTSNKKRRMKAFVLSLVSICILSIHFLINIFIIILSFSVGGINFVNGYVLLPFVVLQPILLIYNSIFVCVVGRSLREKNEQGEVEIPETSGRATRVTAISNEPQMEPVPPYAPKEEIVPVKEV